MVQQRITKMGWPGPKDSTFETGNPEKNLLSHFIAQSQPHWLWFFAVARQRWKYKELVAPPIKPVFPDQKSRSRHCSGHKQLIQLTQHKQHYHQWQHCTEQEYCLPKKTLSISCHSLTVALESRCFWYLLLLDLSNNAKCLATEQSKQVSDSCSFQLTMILTKNN